MTFDIEKLKAQEQLHVDFTELDEAYDGMYVKLKRAYFLPYALYMKLWQEDGPEDESDYQRAVRRLKVHVIEWNIPNLSTGEVQPIPSVDPEILSGMRTEWVAFMGAKMVQDYTDSISQMGKALNTGEENSEDTSENPTSSDQDSSELDDYLTSTGT